jgi:hypothetical protein
MHMHKMSGQVRARDSLFLASDEVAEDSDAVAIGSLRHSTSLAGPSQQIHSPGEKDGAAAGQREEQTPLPH